MAVAVRRWADCSTGTEEAWAGYPWHIFGKQASRKQGASKLAHSKIWIPAFARMTHYVLESTKD
ncbi:hypothetical protein AMJ86_05150 [bacterium SM23_57]|nr:MAG: hypothetical protein AMJ86_05150 [bacterium SM23_57]